MPESHHFLTNLALVLCVAAVTSLLFQRLHQPVVFGYLFAGMLIGPHIPVPLVADEGLVHTLAELGVILLMFALGLEFSLRKLFRVAPTAGIIALLQCSAMIFLGFGLGRLFGWTVLESVYAGAIIAISSTTIILKAFAEQKVSGKVADIVFGVLIIEDLIAILLIAILMTVSSGGNLGPWELTRTGMRLAAFLVGLIAVGLLVVPRLVRATVRLGSPETTLVTAVGISFATALLALSFGYSVALGAFIGGSLVAESGQAEKIEHLVAPVRDMFAAIFFVAVGMLIDPALIARALAAGARPDARRDRRESGLGVDRLVPGGVRDPHIGADRDEPGPDRRVLLHHRGDRPRDRGHAVVSLPHRGRGLRHHHPLNPLADPLGGPGGLVRGPQASPTGADLRVALRELARASPPPVRRADQVTGPAPARRPPGGRIAARGHHRRRGGRDRDPDPASHGCVGLDRRLGQTRR